VDGSTKKKAQDSLREIEDQVRKGIFIPDRKIPNFKDVAKDWIEYKKDNVRASSLKMYKGHLKHHFTAIDPIRINHITTSRVENFISEKQQNGMNLTTLRKIIVTFNQVMNYATRHRYIDHNPVRDAERPRNQGNEIEPEIRIIKPREINAFLSAEKDPEYRTLFML
jgi:integrase